MTSQVIPKAPGPGGFSAGSLHVPSRPARVLTSSCRSKTGIWGKGEPTLDVNRSMNGGLPLTLACAPRGPGAALTVCSSP